MIQIISGVKGKGKTKYLIQKVNDAVKGSKGNIVYLDKNNKHMYELSNKIRLINVKDYPLDNYDSCLLYTSLLLERFSLSCLFYFFTVFLSFRLLRAQTT